MKYLLSLLPRFAAVTPLTLLVCWLQTAQAATFVVDTISDKGEMACTTVPNDCSLRGAIENANTNSGLDTIAFNLPYSPSDSPVAGFKTFSFTHELPRLTDPGTFIDGHSQPGYRNRPLIILSGYRTVSSFPSAIGLAIAASDCHIRGLTLQGWDTAIKIGGAGAHSNQIEGCYIGTDASGTVASPNRLGVDISSGAHDNSIGGVARNVISGNTERGIFITGDGSNGNQIFNSFIGLNVNGDGVLGNHIDGIRIEGRVQRCTIGSRDGALRNIISGNGPSNASSGSGISIKGSESAYHTIINNYIGTDATGNKNGFGNRGPGVLLISSHSNRIGIPGAPRNVISGNAGRNIKFEGGSRNFIQNNFIGPRADGSGAIGSSQPGFPFMSGIDIESETAAPTTGNVIGGTESGARNIISGNGEWGIYIRPVVIGTRIQGNFIGTNPQGNAALPNGIGIENLGANTLIGGTTPPARNVISGNGSTSFSPATGIMQSGFNAVVQGNFIGTDARGLVALPNQEVGINVARPAVIGGLTNRPGTGAGNLIGGNQQCGVQFDGSFYGSLNNARILGNLIGTDVTGRAALPNGEGIRVGDSRNTAIGNGQSSGRNIISGNTSCGIRLIPTSDFETVALTRIQGNYIGTDISGQQALPNRRGIQMDNARSPIIGGATARPGTGQGNIISGNLSAGIYGSPQAFTSYIYGNAIGVAADGKTPLPNRSVDGVGGWGIFVSSVGFNIGAPGDLANLIAHNEAAGVAVVKGEDRALAYPIRGNSIFNNGGLGIDLGDDGPTPNDDGDADTGANNLQNFPTLISATQSALDAPLLLRGTLNSTPDHQFAIDVYASSTPDPSGFGEGEIYLGSFNISTGSGTIDFNQSLDVEANLSGKFISLTATDISTYDTSEFSAVVEVNAPTTNEVPVVNGTAYASNSAITLIFEHTLKSAGTSSFTNQINGYDVTIKSSDITGKTITLLLPQNSLHAGDKIEVAWRNLQTQSGKQLNGNTSIIAE